MRTPLLSSLLLVALRLAGASAAPVAEAQQPLLPLRRLPDPAANNLTAAAFSAKLRQGMVHLDAYLAIRRYGQLMPPPWPLRDWMASTSSMMHDAPFLHDSVACVTVALDVFRLLSRLESRISADSRLARGDPALLPSLSTDRRDLHHFAARAVEC